MEKALKSTAKEAAGRAAAELVKDGMTVGIGTGSTAHYFIQALSERCQKGLSIRGVATSIASHEQAHKAGIPMIAIDETVTIDLDIDGADEIDPQKRMIKGGGGALLREKIVATHAHEMIVVIDEGKKVDQLGAFGLPIELLPFGYTHTLTLLEKMGFDAELRIDDQGEPCVTDSGNFLADIPFQDKIQDPDSLHQMLSALPGVIETGLFLQQAGRVLVGCEDGSVKEW